MAGEIRVQAMMVANGYVVTNNDGEAKVFKDRKDALAHIKDSLPDHVKHFKDLKTEEDRIAAARLKAIEDVKKQQAGAK